MVFKSHQLSPYMITVEGYGIILFLQLIPSKSGFGLKGRGWEPGQGGQGKERNGKSYYGHGTPRKLGNQQSLIHGWLEDKRAHLLQCSVFLTVFPYKEGRAEGYQKVHEHTCRRMYVVFKREGLDQKKLIQPGETVKDRKSVV